MFWTVPRLFGVLMLVLGAVPGVLLVVEITTAGSLDSLLFWLVLTGSGLLLMLVGRPRGAGLIARMQNAIEVGDERYLREHLDDLHDELGQIQDKIAELSFLQHRAREVREACEFRSTTEHLTDAQD